MSLTLEAQLELLITDLLDSAELDLNAASATIELTAKNRLITRAGTQIDTAVRVRELLEASRPLPGDFEALSVSESNEKADQRVARYRCRDIGYGVEEGEVLLPAITAADWTGKRTYNKPDGGLVFLFDDEVVEDTYNVAQQIEEIRRVANARTLSDDVVNGISVGELLDRAVEPVDIDQ